MYADRYTGQRRFNPGGLAAAIGINVAVVGALMVAAPIITSKPPVDGPITTYPVPIEPPPPPNPAPRTLPRTERPVDAPLPPIPMPTNDWTPVPLPPLPGPLTGTDNGAGTGSLPGDGPVTAPTPVLPVIVAPGIDPRYARDFQPLYPPAEQRLGNAGKVTVRVLIGTDGRVKQVERIEASSDAFFRATETQALRKWRFRPGTRDGMPQEVWRTMTVTFVLAD